MQTLAPIAPLPAQAAALPPLLATLDTLRPAQALPKSLAVYLDALKKADRRLDATRVARDEEVDEAAATVALNSEETAPLDPSAVAALEAGPGEPLMQLADAGKRTATDAGTRTQQDDGGGLAFWWPYAGAGLLGGALIGSALDKDEAPPAAPLQATFTAAQEAIEAGAEVSGQLTAQGGRGRSFSLVGEVPGLTVDSDGRWTFDPTVVAYQALAEGEQRVLTVAYEVSGDGQTDTNTFTITVKGTNDAPVATYTQAHDATEGGALITGELSAQDDDAGAVLSYALVGDDVPGLTLHQDGRWSFDPGNAAYGELAMDETQAITVEYTVTDDEGATSTEQFTITVTGVPGSACLASFTLPEHPTDPTALRLEVPELGEEMQASGSSLVYGSGHTSFIADVGYRGVVGGAYVVTAAGDMGDLFIHGEQQARMDLEINAAGGVGNVTFALGLDVDHADLDVNANGDIGDVLMLSSGQNTGGYLDLVASGGNVGELTLQAANSSGSTYMFVQAIAQADGEQLVGGHIGDLALTVFGTQAYGQILADAIGGDVGNISLCFSGASASGTVNVSAVAMVNGAGQAVGGNVGDIDVHLTGATSADNTMNIRTDGVYDASGAYLGGGAVGNVSLYASGGSAEADLRIEALSGGSVGHITLLTTDEGYSAHTSASVNVYGGGGQVAQIGDVTIDVLGGQGNMGKAFLGAYSGGDINSVVAKMHSGFSGRLYIAGSAFANASGAGGSIGDITVTDEGFGTDTTIRLGADTSVGNVSVTGGRGSGELTVGVYSQNSAAVGDIHIVLDDQNYRDPYQEYNDAQQIALVLHEGSTAGDITLEGGSDLSSFKVLANGTLSQWDQLFYNGLRSEVAADVDATDYAGYLHTNLSHAGNGVSIQVGQGGSLVIGTRGSDTITLGEGADSVELAFFDQSVVDQFAAALSGLNLRSEADTVTGFDAAQDAFEVFNSMDYDPFIDLLDGDANVLHELDSNDVTTLADRDVVKLVDVAGGDDIMTADGLRDALLGGEYGQVSGVAGAFVFATATSANATDFNLYHVSHDGTAYTEVYLMAEVSFLAGSTFADLSLSNFA